MTIELFHLDGSDRSARSCIQGFRLPLFYLSIPEWRSDPAQTCAVRHRLYYTSAPSPPPSRRWAPPPTPLRETPVVTQPPRRTDPRRPPARRSPSPRASRGPRPGVGASASTAGARRRSSSWPPTPETNASNSISSASHTKKHAASLPSAPAAVTGREYSRSPPSGSTTFAVPAAPTTTAAAEAHELQPPIAEEKAMPIELAPLLLSI
ncbi:unnamed protein product [Musa acuminata var. zebrina]